ncbi:MAG: DUF1801 domain-containing protein [Candidatus Solibacter sp.]|nr:DUF1801 domain-containing protein [Candidatus Solibacter sp.]
MATRKPTPKVDSPETQLDAFLDKYAPAIATLALACLAKMRTRLPGAVQLVYDNYNALVIGFGPSERASEAIFSLALYPRWVTLFFLQGVGLPDPKQLLKGSGKVVRHIVLASAADLDQPAIQHLISKALQRAEVGIDPAAPGRLVIRSISARQRPRRPV